LSLFICEQKHNDFKVIIRRAITFWKACYSFCRFCLYWFDLFTKANKNLSLVSLMQSHIPYLHLTYRNVL